MVLVYVELAPAGVYSYLKPLLDTIKRRFPDGVYLDMDSFSEDFLVTQMCRLVDEADTCAVCFVSAGPEIPLGAAIRLAEILIRRQPETLVILQGQHTRLERLLKSRGNIIFSDNPTEEVLLAQLAAFLA